MIERSITWLGRYTLTLSHAIGKLVLFLYRAIQIGANSRLKLSKLITQMYHIGVESLPIIALTGLFTGMVFALQSYVGFQRIGGEQLIGAVVSLGMVRELGPVLTGLMVTGRAGSAITAEIGTMRITEQLDALTTLCINPYQYLIIPRILAGILIVPCLALFAIVCGIIGGYIVVTFMLDLSPEQYLANIRYFVSMHDVMTGIIKSAFFGFILTWVSCFKGYYSKGGSRGVATATTETVVLSSMMILIINYFLTRILEYF